MSKEPSNQSIEIAAQCWCDKETSMIEMDSRLAMAFAKRLDAAQAPEMLLLNPLVRILIDELIDVRNSPGRIYPDQIEYLDKALAPFEKDKP